MSWAGIAGNQTVTFNNLQDAVNTGVFTLKNSIPVSQECITKNDADYYVNINTSYPPYAAKSSFQLVVKTDLVATSPTNTVTYVASSGIYPLSGNVSISTTGTITNYFSTSMLVWVVFNSAGLNSGTVNNDSMVIVPLSPQSISGATITGYGQVIYGGTYTMAANTAYTISLTKADLLGGGSTLRFYYSNIFGGGLTMI